MSAFLYFAVGVHKPVAWSDLDGLGLRYAFEEAPQSSLLQGRTPAGDQAGMLIWSQPRLGAAEPGYYPDAQEWRKIPGREGLYVGCYAERRPTPESLRRRQVMAGEAVTLGDGGAWTIPRLKLFAGEEGFVPAYPVVVDLDDEGHWVSGGASGDALAMAALFDRLFAGMTSPRASRPRRDSTRAWSCWRSITWCRKSNARCCGC